MKGCEPKVPFTLKEAQEALLRPSYTCRNCADSRNYTCASCRDLYKLRSELPALYAAQARLPRLRAAYKALRKAMNLPT